MLLLRFWKRNSSTFLINSNWKVSNIRPWKNDSSLTCKSTLLSASTRLATVAIGYPERHLRSHATITLLLLVRATYTYRDVLHAHPVRDESHNQRNTTGEVATLRIHWRKRTCWSTCFCLVLLKHDKRSGGVVCSRAECVSKLSSVDVFCCDSRVCTVIKWCSSEADLNICLQD